MKFYLTKAAQRAAEGKAPVVKASKEPKAPVATTPTEPKAPVVKAPVVKAPSEPKAPVVNASSAPKAAETRKPATAGSSTSGAASPAQAAAVPSAPGSPASAPESALVGSPTASLSAAMESSGGAASPGGAEAAVTVPPTKKVWSVNVGFGRETTAKDKTPKPPKSTGVIAVGGEARVDLLPVEVRLARRASTQVRRLWLGVAGLAAVAAIATGGATLYAQDATTSLTSTQAATSSLTSQEASYASVKTTESQLALVKAAQQVGGSTDIDWSTYIAAVERTLPSGMKLSNIEIDSASPVTAYAQSTTPLEGQRVATLTLTSTSSTLPSIPTWLTNLSTLTGFVDATPGSVALSSGTYTSNVTVHINQKAFSNVYAAKGK